MSLVIVIWMTYYIYQSIKKEKYTVLSILFFVLFSFTLLIDCFSFVGGTLFSINALMAVSYTHLDVYKRQQLFMSLMNIIWIILRKVIEDL